MPIINMTSNDPAGIPEGIGAYCPLDRDNLERVANGNTPIVLYESHHGLCIREWEHNMRDDSDFFMSVWNPEKQATENIMFATTRGWSYPCYGSRADASDEVKALAAAYKAEQERKGRVLRKWRRRQEMDRTAVSWRMTRREVQRVVNAFSRDEFDRVDALMKVKNFRSKFRASLAKQIRAWAADASPRYASPLSPRQRECM